MKTIKMWQYCVILYVLAVVIGSIIRLATVDNYPFGVFAEIGSVAVASVVDLVVMVIMGYLVDKMITQKLWANLTITIFGYYVLTYIVTSTF